MSGMAQALPRPVLADVLPGGLVRDVSLVVGSAAFVGVVGNVAVPLPFTPVPLSLATFAVLLTGRGVGSVAGRARHGAVSGGGDGRDALVR